MCTPSTSDPILNNNISDIDYYAYFNSSFSFNTYFNSCNNFKVRRVTRRDSLVITTNENLLLIDNGCDQSIVSTNSFIVGVHTGQHFHVEGAVECMAAANLELVNDAVTCIVMDVGPNILIKLNQCLLDVDSKQHESLLQPHQARAFGVIVDDCTRCHLGVDGNAGG